MTECRCENVQPWDDGTWRCMLCCRIFLPADLCDVCPLAQCEEQQEAEESRDAN